MYKNTKKMMKELCLDNASEISEPIKQLKKRKRTELCRNWELDVDNRDDGCLIAICDVQSSKSHKLSTSKTKETTYENVNKKR